MSERRRTAPAEPEAAIDPWVAARLADVAAERRVVEVQARRRRAIIGLACFVAVAALFGLALSPVLGAHEVEVAGAERTRPTDVARATGLTGSDPLIRIDAGAVTRRVEALPWVLKADLDRRWPQTVRISVSERTPVAVAPCAEGSCVVDSTGRALAGVQSPGVDAPDAVDAGDLPVLADVPPAGAPGSVLPAGAKPALAVALALPESLRPLVLAVRGTPRGVEIALDVAGRERNPPVIRMGDASKISEKLTAAATVIKSRGPSGLQGLDVLDVRTPGAPALTASGAAP